MRQVFESRVRRTVAVVSALCISVAAPIIIAQPAQAYSECTTGYTASTGVYSRGSCLAASLSLNAAKAPQAVSGTIGRNAVSLKGGAAVSGRIGSQAVRLRDYTIGPPNWGGTLGSKKVRIGEGVYGLECIIGGSVFRVSSPFFGEGAKITDNSNGAICLALILAADLIDEI